MRIDVSLRGSKADQFERIQEHLEERRSHELSRADVTAQEKGLVRWNKDE